MCFLPLSPCGREWLREAKTGEASASANPVPADRDPSSGTDFVHLLPQGEKEESAPYFFAARSTKVLPPFILWASGASLIWITTASESTPRFFTSACVMSRIMPAFCSSVRPAAMLTVISGILVSSFSFSVMAGLVPAIHDFSCIKQDVDARHKAGHDAGMNG